MVGALIQISIVVKLFINFFRWRRVEQTYLGAQIQAYSSVGLSARRASSWFPWLALGSGLTAVALFILLIVSVSLTDAYEHEALPLLLFAVDLSVGIALLGLGTGLASLLLGYRYKGLSIAGMTLSAVLPLIEIALALTWFFQRTGAPKFIHFRTSFNRNDMVFSWRTPIL